MFFNRKVAQSLRKTMWLARLEPNYDEIPLRLEDATSTAPHVERDEANWTPLVHNDTLFTVYTFCPYT